MLERDHPTLLRVTRLEGSRLEIRNPRVDGDSLIGLPYRNPEGISPKLSVPLSDIDYVETRKTSTTPWILGIGLIVPLALSLWVAATWD